MKLWSWAGLKANETLRAALGSPEGQFENDAMILRDFDDPNRIRLAELGDVVPVVPPEMADSLKFSAALPNGVAMRTLAERFADRQGAQAVADDAPLVQCNP